MASKKNPYLNPTEQHGQRSEKRVVERVLGGKVTPASGALLGCKSDGTVDTQEHDLRVESKATVNASISIKHDWLQKIAQEARETNRQPVLTLSFTYGNGQAKRDGDWVMIPARLLKELLP